MFGMISQRNLLDMEKQKVILVDHNEKDQAAEGIRSTEIVEIIDHHRIDSVETNNPIYFRNQPLGCTATVVALMYQENQIAISPTIAGLLCSAILSRYADVPLADLHDDGRPDGKDAGQDSGNRHHGARRGDVATRAPSSESARRMSCFIWITSASMPRRARLP